MPKEHKHAKAMRAVANGFPMEFRVSGRHHWHLVNPKYHTFREINEYRPFDPLREVKEAHAKGQIIECRPKDDTTKSWKAINRPSWLNSHEYRVPPQRRVEPAYLMFHTARDSIPVMAFLEDGQLVDVEIRK